MSLFRRVIKYPYISIIRKYPNGIDNRLHHFDQWAKTWNQPHIKSYYDCFHNGETRKHQMFIPSSEAAKHDVALAATRFRPNIFELHEKTNIDQDYFADDHFVPTDLTGKKLTAFIKECFKPQTRTATHKYFMLCIAVLMLNATGLYHIVFNDDFNMSVVQLEPAEQFYHYNLNEIEKDVEAYIEKINFLNKHCNDVLEQAKERAFKRMQP